MATLGSTLMEELMKHKNEREARGQDIIPLVLSWLVDLVDSTEKMLLNTDLTLEEQLTAYRKALIERVEGEFESGFITFEDAGIISGIINEVTCASRFKVW